MLHHQVSIQTSAGPLGFCAHRHRVGVGDLFGDLPGLVCG
jgi:hypothetical protein